MALNLLWAKHVKERKTHNCVLSIFPFWYATLNGLNQCNSYHITYTIFIVIFSLHTHTFMILPCYYYLYLYRKVPLIIKAIKAPRALDWLRVISIYAINVTAVLRWPAVFSWGMLKVTQASICAWKHNSLHVIYSEICCFMHQRKRVIRLISKYLHSSKGGFILVCPERSKESRG